MTQRSLQSESELNRVPGLVWFFCQAFLLLGVFCWVALRMRGFLAEGILGPDFALIHQAYDLFFATLPLLLSVLTVGFVAGSLCFRVGRWRGFLIPLLTGFLTLDLVVLRYYVTHVEPERLVVRYHEFEAPKLSGPLRIVHLTDTHIPYWDAYAYRVFETIRELEPDLILHTGDYMHTLPGGDFRADWAELIRVLSTLDPKYGIFGVFGDTDFAIHQLPIEARGPLVLLSSRDYLLETAVGVIHLHGLNLNQSREPEWGHRSIRAWLENSPDPAFRILMGHAPDVAMGLEDAPIDLILAGHTHGGQVRLPFYGPLVIDSEVPRAWARGFRSIGRPHLNVSAGAGSNRHEGLPPIRLNCPTELTVIDLIPSR